MNKKFIRMLSAVLCICLCVCGCQKQGEEAPETTESTGPAKQAVDSTLYYNIDGATYNGKAADSLTSREKNLEDGYFHVLTASEGKIVEVLVKSRILANKIDSNPVLAFSFSEDNIVEDAVPVEEIGGSVAARNYYVTSAEGNKLVVNTNNTNSGEEHTFDMADGVGIYDVSDRESSFGEVTELEAMDEIIAAADSTGKVTRIWVLSRASQNKGRGGCICGVGDSGEPHKEGCDGSILYYWQPWTNETSLPTSGGYWYLDVEGGVVNLNETVKIKSSADIFLDLNGHTVNGPGVSSGAAAFYMAQDASLTVNLTILDSKGGGTWMLRDPKDPDGNVTLPLQARFVVMVSPKHTLNIYGGTVDGSKIIGSGGHGALIRMINGAVLNIHGGTIIGTKVPSTTGGAVFCSGTMNMTGGTIRDGHARKGGNVFIGTYENGGVTYYGSFNMTGGEILGGTATEAGGNMCYYGDGEFNQTGGTISGGTAPDSAEIYVYPKFDPAA